MSKRSRLETVVAVVRVVSLALVGFRAAVDVAAQLRREHRLRECRRQAVDLAPAADDDDEDAEDEVPAVPPFPPFMHLPPETMASLNTSLRESIMSMRRAAKAIRQDGSK